MCGGITGPGPAPSPVNIAPVVGVVEVKLRIQVKDLILDSVTALIPSVAAMPGTLEVANVSADARVLPNLACYAFPPIPQVRMAL